MSLEHAILGFLADEPLTGYDLKKAFDASVQNFWHANQSQIYRSLKKMEHDGWVTQEVVPQGDRPPRKLYHLTDEGMAELVGWLAIPARVRRMRMEWLVKVFFAHPEMPMITFFGNVKEASVLMPENPFGEESPRGQVAVTNMSRPNRGTIGIRLERSAEFGPTGEERYGSNVFGNILSDLSHMLKDVHDGDIIYLRERKEGEEIKTAAAPAPKPAFDLDEIAEIARQAEFAQHAPHRDRSRVGQRRARGRRPARRREQLRRRQRRRGEDHERRDRNQNDPDDDSFGGSKTNQVALYMVINQHYRHRDHASGKRQDHGERLHTTQNRQDHHHDYDRDHKRQRDPLEALK